MFVTSSVLTGSSWSEKRNWQVGLNGLKQSGKCSDKLEKEHKKGKQYDRKKVINAKIEMFFSEKASAESEVFIHSLNSGVCKVRKEELPASEPFLTQQLFHSKALKL